MKKTYPIDKDIWAWVAIYIVASICIIVWHDYGYQVAVNKTLNTSEKVNTLNIGNLFSDMNTSLFASIQEKDFVDYAQTVIEGRCPFYKPDGISYRECLSDWEQHLEAVSLPEQADEVHAYCSTFTKKYTDEESLEGQELFLKCAIFKLR